MSLGAVNLFSCFPASLVCVVISTCVLSAFFVGHCFLPVVTLFLDFCMIHHSCQITCQLIAMPTIVLKVNLIDMSESVFADTAADL